MEPQPAAASRSALVRWMGITDANQGGFVHGGTVMKLCDEVAGLAAIRHSRCRVVTGGMDRMIFLERVEIGELVTFKASVDAVWRTSMEVGVRVEAERRAAAACATRAAPTSRWSPSTMPAGRRRFRRW